jgi:hypothetical protein
MAVHAAAQQEDVEVKGHDGRKQHKGIPDGVCQIVRHRQPDPIEKKLL